MPPHVLLSKPASGNRLPLLAITATMAVTLATHRGQVILRTSLEVLALPVRSCMNDVKHQLPYPISYARMHSLMN